ncbi:p53 and DNA damage-regulated protein 1 [Aphis craccivora]|uniref:p53 and DNA damage-regulated protein 1 n=1 Tax=Aphis craccivora TaxID=307492 RepID=A0A6G0YVG7_APHCR|nr:p53 and DNA damage-regulated protein 1 [Aphis craccivora]
MNNENTTMEYLFQVERQAEKILLSKSEMVALDKSRNSNRMAIRALTNSKNTEDKIWMAVGLSLVKVSVEKAKNMLQADQVTLNNRMNILRSNIKVDVNKLNDMEYKEPVKGLFLNPLTRKEMQAMNQVLGTAD